MKTYGFNELNNAQKDNFAFPDAADISAFGRKSSFRKAKRNGIFASAGNSASKRNVRRILKKQARRSAKLEITKQIKQND